MDVSTCWKWFEEVFYPEVRKRTGRPVLLFMDNAPGHFQLLREITLSGVFPTQLHKLETALRYGNYCSIKKDINIYIPKIFWISTSWMRI